MGHKTIMQKLRRARDVHRAETVERRVGWTSNSRRPELPPIDYLEGHYLSRIKPELLPEAKELIGYAKERMG